MYGEINGYFCMIGDHMSVVCRFLRLQIEPTIATIDISEYCYLDFFYYRFIVSSHNYALIMKCYLFAGEITDELQI